MANYYGRAVFLFWSTTFAAIPLFGQEIPSITKEEENRFQRHKDNYILLTSAHDAREVKFQMSFKYRLNDNIPLYFAYTQKSFWDAWDFANSSPFIETDFNPEIFVGVFSDTGTMLQRIRVGVEHESNGRNGSESRSLNRVYLEPKLSLLGSSVLLVPRVWVPFTVAKENADISHYEGYASIELRVALPVRPDVGSIIAKVQKGDSVQIRNSSLELSVVFRPLALLDLTQYAILNGSFYFQYWSGVGESLQNYNVPAVRYRFGFILVR